MANVILSNSQLEEILSAILKDGDKAFIHHSVSSDTNDVTQNPTTGFKFYEYDSNGYNHCWGRVGTPIGTYHLWNSGYYRYKWSRGSDKIIKSSTTHNYYYGTGVDMLSATWSNSGSETTGSQIFVWYLPSYANDDSIIKSIIEEVDNGQTPTPAPWLSTAQHKKPKMHLMHFNDFTEHNKPYYKGQNQRTGAVRRANNQNRRGTNRPQGLRYFFY